MIMTSCTDCCCCCCFGAGRQSDEFFFPCRTWRATKTKGVEIGVCCHAVGGLIRSAPVAECVCMVGGCVGERRLWQQSKRQANNVKNAGREEGGGCYICMPFDSCLLLLLIAVLSNKQLQRVSAT